MTSIGQLSWQMPVILITSLFIAIILNSKFAGRTFVRAVFFLPAIMVTGTIITIIKQDVAASSVLSGSVVSAGNIQYSTGLQDLLVQSGANSKMVELFTTVSNDMYNLLWKTGIQMIVFLAGMQSISPALYEAADIEGATAWEKFWKITIPMLSSIILVNIVYTIVDNFTDSTNVVMNQVMANTEFLRLGLASAMAWTYFLVIGIIIAIIVGIFSKINSKTT